MTIEGRDPTPEELVDQLAKYHGKSPVKYDRVLRRVIKDAEHLGQAHQRAVSQFMAELAGVPTAQAQSAASSWKLWTDLDVTLEICLKIDDRLFVARKLVDHYQWLHFREDIPRWEEFLNFFTRQAVGSMSQDPDQFAYLRRKLFVVTPDDRHDSRLCRASNDTGLNQNLWPRCLSGVVRKTLPVDLSWFDERPLGRCACRCHKHPLNQLDHQYHVGFLTPYDDRGFFI